MIGIYKITNPTGKVYIGQSWNINKRKVFYSNLLCKRQVKIYNSLKKYGWENHKFEIVHELPFDITQIILDTYEILYLQKYNECGFKMLNIRGGGSKGKLSATTIQKIKQSWTDNRRESFAKTKIGDNNVSKRFDVSEKKKNAMLAKPIDLCPNCKKVGYIHQHFQNCRIGKYKNKSNYKKVNCPHCKIEMDPGNAKKYHFEKCKFKKI